MSTATTFTMRAEALSTVLPFVSTDESRPVLNHVALLSGGRICATDGITLGMFRSAHDHDGGEILLPVTPELKKLVKAAKWGDGCMVVELVSDTEARVSSFSNGVSILLALGEGPFPDVTRVFPWNEHPTPLPTITFQSKYAARFGRNIRLTFYGPKRCMIVRTPDERFIGLFIPFKDFTEDRTAPDALPAWIRG